MPVIDLLKAQRVGKVKNAFLNATTGRLAALDVGHYGAFKHAHVAGRHVRRIGHQAIVLVSAEDLEDAAMLSEDMIDIRTLLGIEVLTDEGDRVGHVSDVYLNPDMLSVDAYELRTPPLTRLFKGPRMVAPERMVLCSHQLMIVTPLGREATHAIVTPEADLALPSWRDGTVRVLSPGVAALNDHSEPLRPVA